MNTATQPTPDDDFVLLAVKNGTIRALASVSDLNCKELAECLIDWHEYDTDRRPAVMLLSEAMNRIRQENAALAKAGASA